jgi:ketosteroid isomerase-like protein
MQLTDPNFAHEFASNWIKNWNNRDVEAVLSHFDDDCIFESPLGKTYAGSPVIRGKQALRSYWLAALDRIKSLKFELESAVWDPNERTLVVFSIAHLDERTMRACEAMVFAPNGRQRIGRAYYGYASE